MVPVGVLSGWARGPGAEPEGGGPFFLLAWFPFWTVAGLMMMLALGWNLAGREVILLDEGALVVRREVGGLRRSRSFDLAGVRNLRFSPPAYNPFSMSGSWGQQLQMLGLAGGVVAFDHGGTTHRFGNGLSEDEAARLIVTIGLRFKIPDDRVVEPLPISKGPAVARVIPPATGPGPDDRRPSPG